MAPDVRMRQGWQPSRSRAMISHDQGSEPRSKSLAMAKSADSDMSKLPVPASFGGYVVVVDAMMIRRRTCFHTEIEYSAFTVPFSYSVLRLLNSDIAQGIHPSSGHITHDCSTDSGHSCGFIWYLSNSATASLLKTHIT